MRRTAFLLTVGMGLLLLGLIGLANLSGVESKGMAVRDSKQQAQDYMQLLLNGMLSEKPVTMVGTVTSVPHTSSNVRTGSNLVVLFDAGPPEIGVYIDVRLKKPTLIFPVDLVGQRVEVTGVVCKCEFGASASRYPPSPKTMSIYTSGTINEASFRLVK